MVRKRKKLALVGVVLLLVGLVPVAFMIQPSAAELLTQALTTMEDLAAEAAETGVADGHAIVEVRWDTPESSGHGTVEIWGSVGGEKPSFRLEVLDAQGAFGGSYSGEDVAGSIAVSNGEEIWLWHDSENTVYTGTAEELKPLVAQKLDGQPFDHGEEGSHSAADYPETADEAVAMLLETFNAERHGFAELGQNRAYEIRLIPIPEQMPDEVRAAGGFINVWIGTESNLPLGIEYAEGAIGSAKVTATTLELNEGIDPTIFDFQIPEGATVIQLADLLAAMGDATAASAESAASVDFELLSPGYLPSGAKLTETFQVGGAHVERYSLGEGKSFTIAQSGLGMEGRSDEEGSGFMVRGVEGTLFTNDDGQRSMLAWREAGLSFIIGGDLGPEELAAVAESLE
jgi:outer membrane lipoprotein-sorting protein